MPEFNDRRPKKSLPEKIRSAVQAEWPRQEKHWDAMTEGYIRAAASGEGNKHELEMVQAWKKRGLLD